MSDLIDRQQAIEALNKAKTVRSESGELFVAKINAQMNIDALPSAELGTNLAEVGTDCISRQQAIDVLRKMQTYKLFSGDDMLLIDQAGAMTELMLLPPTEPQIIRCRDCVNYKDHRCTVANHYVSEKESCAEVFGVKRREVKT